MVQAMTRNQPTPRRRRRDSVRFDPYYKPQVWVPHLLAWRDLQEQHDTPDAAEGAARAAAAGEPVRAMHVTPTGRTPLPPTR